METRPMLKILACLKNFLYDHGELLGWN